MPIGAFKLNSISKYSAPAGGGVSYRTDAYASFLKLAVPFDSVNGTNDIAYQISGTGLSASATKTQGASATTGSTQVQWSNYGAAEINSRAGAALTYALPTSIPTSASGSYVVEGWFYATDASTNSNWVLSSADSAGRWLLGLHTGTTNQFASENWVGLNGTGWHHCAIVCDAGTKRFYVDAIYKGAFATTNTGFSTLHVGQFNASDANDFLGYIQDLRVYIGTNKGYTGTSTTVQNFLTPNSIINLTRAQNSISAVGNAQVSTAQSKFDGTSAFLDGASGNQLSVTNWNSSDITTEFTWESWVYFTSVTAENYAMLYMNGASSATQDYRQVYLGFSGAGAGNTGLWLALGQAGASSFLNFPPASNFVINTWYHIAVSRDSSSNIRAFVNGTQIGTTQNNTRAWASQSAADSFTIGRFRTDVYRLRGYLDEYRISKKARYTANFTAPTTPFVNDPNTAVLIHAHGNNTATTFADDNGSRSQRNVQVIGNVQVSTAQSKFGGASALFDAVNDYLKIFNPTALGSGSFTIEAWIRPSVVTGTQVIYDDRTTTNDASKILIFMSGTSLIYYSTASHITGTAAIPTANTWYHVAACRDGTTVRLFVNGTQVGSNYTDTGTKTANSFNVAIFGQNSENALAGGFTDNEFNGYMDEIRISNSARYTANFTAPTAAFTNDANTLLLIHADGTNGSSSFTDDNT